MDRRNFLTRLLVLTGGLAAVAATTRTADAFTLPPPDLQGLKPEPAVLGEGDTPQAETVRWVWRPRRRRVFFRRRVWRRRWW